MRTKWQVWLAGAALLTATSAMAGDEVVVINNHTTQTYKVDNAKATINGDNCTLKFDGSCASLTVRGKKSDIQVAGHAGTVVVPGIRNQIKLMGGVDDCNVGGTDNHIVIAGPTADGKPTRLEITGAGNVLEWSKAAVKVAPLWLDDGQHNTLKQVP